MQQPDQQALAEASKQELITALNERDQLLSLVKEISNSMERIESLENILTVNDMQPREQSTQRTRIRCDNAVNNYNHSKPEWTNYHCLMMTSEI